MSASEFVTDLRRRGRDSRPVSRVVRAGRASAASVQRQYSSDQPLRGYATLIGVYVAAGATAVWASGRGKAADRSISTGDLVRITIAAHRLSRTLTEGDDRQPAAGAVHAAQRVGHRLRAQRGGAALGARPARGPCRR